MVGGFRVIVGAMGGYYVDLLSERGRLAQDFWTWVMDASRNVRRCVRGVRCLRYARARVCVCVCARARVCVCVCLCVRLSGFYAYIYICMYIHVYTHIRIYIYIYICINNFLQRDTHRSCVKRVAWIHSITTVSGKILISTPRGGSLDGDLRWGPRSKL